MSGLFVAVLLVSCILQVNSLPSRYLCKSKRRGENCFVIINLLRSPHQAPNWSVSLWNRAMNQHKAYQQLFQENDVMRRRRSADNNNGGVIVRQRRKL